MQSKNVVAFGSILAGSLLINIIMMGVGIMLCIKGLKLRKEDPESKLGLAYIILGFAITGNFFIGSELFDSLNL